jgi:hypothetical protein
MKKMTIATANPVTFKFYEFISVKIRGTNRWTSFGKKKQSLGGLGGILFFSTFSVFHTLLIVGPQHNRK